MRDARLHHSADSSESLETDYLDSAFSGEFNVGPKSFQQRRSNAAAVDAHDATQVTFWSEPRMLKYGLLNALECLLPRQHLASKSVIHELSQKYVLAYDLRNHASLMRTSNLYVVLTLNGAQPAYALLSPDRKLNYIFTAAPNLLFVSTHGANANTTTCIARILATLLWQNLRLSKHDVEGVFEFSMLSDVVWLTTAALWRRWIGKSRMMHNTYINACAIIKAMFVATQSPEFAELSTLLTAVFSDEDLAHFDARTLYYAGTGMQTSFEIWLTKQDGLWRAHSLVPQTMPTRVMPSSPVAHSHKGDPKNIEYEKWNSLFVEICYFAPLIWQCKSSSKLDEVMKSRSNEQWRLKDLDARSIRAFAIRIPQTRARLMLFWSSWRAVIPVVRKHNIDFFRLLQFWIQASAVAITVPALHQLFVNRGSLGLILSRHHRFTMHCLSLTAHEIREQVRIVHNKSPKSFFRTLLLAKLAFITGLRSTEIARCHLNMFRKAEPLQILKQKCEKLEMFSVYTLSRQTNPPAA